MKLSIITICKNDLAGLKKTIPSVLSQSYSDFEYIVIDGGSTDGSVDFIKSNSERISYWISEQDRGIYHAMNKGIEAAKGEYCLFLNSGDYLAEDKVLQKVFQNSFSESILYGDMIFEEGNTKTVRTQPDKISFEQMVYAALWHPVTFIKRSLFDIVGKYNEEYKIVSDFEFTLKAIFLHNASTRHLNIPVSVFNMNGISTDPKHQLLHDTERMQVLRKYFPESVIASAMNYNLLRRSRAFKLAEWLKSRPKLLGIVTGLYKFLKKIRKNPI